MTSKTNSSRPQPISNAVRVVGLRDQDGTQWVQITFRGNTGLVPYDAFGGERSAVGSALRDAGLTIVSSAARKALVEQVEALARFDRRVIFARPGWCEGQFANASGRVFAAPAPGGTTGLIAFKTNNGKCGTAGTLAEWLEQVATPLKGHHLPSFALMAAFAAPMLDLSGRTGNFGFELAGEAGKGKSTTQRLMASVVGPVMDSKVSYISTFNATPNALEQMMANHADMPFIIDEANLFAGASGGKPIAAKMQDFAFAMGDGWTKARFNATEQIASRFVFVTSANQPFHELLKHAHGNVADAAADRLMSLSVPPGDAGVFGELPDGFANYRAFTLSIESAMKVQYGTAMPRFLSRLVKDRHRDEEKLRARVRELIDRFKGWIGCLDTDGSDVRVAEAFGLVYAAGRIARQYGALPDGFDCKGAAIAAFKNYRQTVPLRQTLPERLRAIAARPETRRIDHKNLPILTDEEVAETGAFIRGVKGEPLLLMTTQFGKRYFPDWRALRGTPDFVRLSRADEAGRGRGKHVQIRRGKKAEWFYAFALPKRGE